jgi:hypothetical protein
MIDGGQKAFDLVPDELANVIKERQWADKVDKNGVAFTSFEKFVLHRRWQGLESSIDDLRAYCRKRPEVAKLIMRAVDPGRESRGSTKEERENRGDNITPKSERGTSATYTLKRLKRDRPDLLERVVAGELSANAAAIAAGFRHKPTPYETITKLLPKLSATERQSLKDIL